MHIKALLALSLPFLLASATPASLVTRARVCVGGGRHIGQLCLTRSPGDYACGDHQLVS